MSGFACCVGLGDGSGPDDPEPLADHAHDGLHAVILHDPLAKGLG